MATTTVERPISTAADLYDRGRLRLHAVRAVGCRKAAGHTRSEAATFPQWRTGQCVPSQAPGGLGAARVPW